MSVTGAVVILIAIALLVWRGERIITMRQADRQALDIQRLAQDRQQAERELELRAREVAVTERATPAIEVPPVTEFPPELLGYAIDESEEWARTDGMLLIAESFVDGGGDWKKAGALLSHRYAMQPPSRIPTTLN